MGGEPTTRRDLVIGPGLDRAPVNVLDATRGGRPVGAAGGRVLPQARSEGGRPREGRDRDIGDAGLRAGRNGGRVRRLGAASDRVERQAVERGLLKRFRCVRIRNADRAEVLLFREHELAPDRAVGRRGCSRTSSSAAPRARSRRSRRSRNQYSPRTRPAPFCANACAQSRSCCCLSVDTGNVSATLRPPWQPIVKRIAFCS